MSEPFLSEIRLFSFEFAPKGWARCEGQLLPINQNQALFSLLGTTYGGNGTTNFALPDLRGRVPVHWGAGHTLGERFGETTHTISAAEMPAHTHPLRATSDDATVSAPSGNVLGTSPANPYVNSPPSATTLNPAGVSTVGGSQPHQNMQPHLALSFCIALQGVFPSKN